MLLRVPTVLEQVKFLVVVIVWLIMLPRRGLMLLALLSPRYDPYPLKIPLFVVVLVDVSSAVKLGLLLVVVLLFLVVVVLLMGTAQVRVGVLFLVIRLEEFIRHSDEVNYDISSRNSSVLTSVLVVPAIATAPNTACSFSWL